MKTWRSRFGIIAVATPLAMLTSIALKASRPPVVPGGVHSAATTQDTADPPGKAQYQFTTINVPGATDTWTYGINDTGVVTGFYSNTGPTGIGYGYFWRNGSFTRVFHNPKDPTENTLFAEVNDLGLVVGNYGPTTTQHAAIYSIQSGQWTTLPDVPNKPFNYGNGINLFGVATGAVGTLISTTGWTWDGRSYSFFSVPGAALSGTFPNGINVLGVVSGYYQDTNGAYHGFRKEGSTFTNIDVPGATGTFAYGLNDFGDQVGNYTDQQGNNHGFLLRAGKFTTIDVPGAVGTIVTNVNNLGDLVGLWFDANGDNHGFIATGR